MQTGGQRVSAARRVHLPTLSFIGSVGGSEPDAPQCISKHALRLDATQWESWRAANVLGSIYEGLPVVRAAPFRSRALSASGNRYHQCRPLLSVQVSMPCKSWFDLERLTGRIWKFETRYYTTWVASLRTALSRAQAACRHATPRSQMNTSTRRRRNPPTQRHRQHHHRNLISRRAACKAGPRSPERESYFLRFSQARADVLRCVGFARKFADLGRPPRRLNHVLLTGRYVWLQIYLFIRCLPRYVLVSAPQRPLISRQCRLLCAKIHDKRDGFDNLVRSLLRNVWTANLKACL